MLVVLRTVTVSLFLVFVVFQGSEIIRSGDLSAFVLKMYAVSYFMYVFFVSIVIANFVWPTVFITIFSFAISGYALLTGSSFTSVIAMQTSSFLGISLGVFLVLAFVFFDIWRIFVRLFTK